MAIARRIDRPLQGRARAGADRRRGRHCRLVRGRLGITCGRTAALAHRQKDLGHLTTDVNVPQGSPVRKRHRCHRRGHCHRPCRRHRRRRRHNIRLAVRPPAPSGTAGCLCRRSVRAAAGEVLATTSQLVTPVLRPLLFGPLRVPCLAAMNIGGGGARGRLRHVVTRRARQSKKKNQIGPPCLQIHKHYLSQTKLNIQILGFRWPQQTTSLPLPKCPPPTSHSDDVQPR